MLEIIYGKNGEKLKKKLFARIREELEEIRAEKSRAKQVLLIVPAQFTLDAEKAAFELLGGKGFLDLLIMSGNKLRSDILRQTGGPGKSAINSLGRSMVLRRVINENSGDFSAFAKVCTKPDFLDLAGDFIVQLKQNRIDPDALTEISRGCGEDSLLRSKLTDMEKIYRDYEEAMAGRFTDSEGLLEYTSSKVCESELVRNSLIWYYDFYSFTPNETAFLGQLMEHSCGLRIAMAHDDSEDPAFEVTGRTIEKLKEEARRHGSDYAVHQIEDDEVSIPPMRLVRCATPYTQAMTIGQEVLRLLFDGKAQCHEIAILTGDMEGCGSAVRRVFSDWGIPLFFDEKRSVMHNSAILFVSSLLDITAEGLQRDFVLSCIKTGFIFDPCSEGVSPEELELFENYAKQYHLSRERFLEPLKYGAANFGEDVLAKLEKIRAGLAAVLCPFIEEINNVNTVKEKTGILYRFLLSLSLPERLDNLSADLSEKGFEDAAGECSQIWGVIIGLMDQAVELLGSAELSPAEFRDVYNNAFKDIRVGLLPQQEGRVTLGTVRRSKLDNIKYLFVAGAAEGQIPADNSGEKLLTEDELAILEDRGFTLNKRSAVLAGEELLNLSRAMSAPTDGLWIGWCLEDGSNNSLRPSPFVLDLLDNGVRAEEDGENVPAFPQSFTGRRNAVSRLSSELLSVASGEKETPDPLWARAYNILRENHDPALDILVKGLLFDNGRKTLGEDSVSALFADEGMNVFSFSASRLENYAACPFRHFVRYGLRPYEPKEFGISPSEAGDIYHQCIMEFSLEMNRRCTSKGTAPTDPLSPWMTLSRLDCEEICSGIMDELREKVQDGVMNAGPLEQFTGKRMKEQFGRFAWQMVRQIRLGSIDRMAFEQSFGYGSEAAPLRVETSAGTVRIQGRIDRMDVSGPYLKIIDYKSGKKNFDLKELQDGYALQLMVYLESAAEKEKLQPAGMFYYLIDDGSAEATLEQLEAGGDMTAADGENEHLMLDGLFLCEEPVISVIDTRAVSQKQSSVIKLKYSRDGRFSANNGVSREELDEIRQAFRKTLSVLCQRLCGGDISPVPHRSGEKTACDYCAYRGMCLFDTQFAENRYR